MLTEVFCLPWSRFVAGQICCAEKENELLRSNISIGREGAALRFSAERAMTVNDIRDRAGYLVTNFAA